MKKIIIIFLFFITTSTAFSSIKNNIINNLINTKNLSFDFEQNINGKIESGTCVMEYPKKIYCAYNLKNKKKLVSNGKSIVIKTSSGSYYRYPISKTPLDYILDKKVLINEIKKSQERIIDDSFINFTILKDGNEINIFFDKNNYNLVGWQTLDIYQNLNITFLSSIEKNQKLSKNLFKLPSQN
ncbi:outer membrane lipoprotein carrier protein LolA [Candidatus Pelagibacter sp.]|nr:outer membrane lipoprotein carrier protein LolA [Candidatus Pelagibacter sp.]